MSRVLLITLIAFFVYGLIQCFVGAMSAIRVRSLVALLRREQPPEVVARRAVLRAVARVANELLAYQKAKTAPRSFSGDLTSIERRLSIPINKARALAGLLIIIGLLLTLFNLQRAVTEMSGAFAKLQPAESPSTRDDPSSLTPERSEISTTASRDLPSRLELQEGMRNVWDAAGRAFKLSATAILLAAMLLLVVAFLGAYISRVVAEFRDWVSEATGSIVRELEPVQRRDPTEALTLVLGRLSGLTTAFQNTSQALIDVQGFGDTLVGAASEISEAVAKVPDHVASSVNLLGTQLAAGVTEGLKHQLHYLNELVVLYGHQSSAMKVITDSVKQAAESAQRASIELGKVPGELVAINESLKLVSDATIKSQKATDGLSEKVDDFPAAEMRAAILDIHEAAKAMASIRTDVSAATTRIEELIRTSNSDVAAGLTQSVQELQESLAGIPSPPDYSHQFSLLGKGITDVSGAVTAGFSGETQQFERLHQSVAGLREIIRSLSAADPGSSYSDLRGLERRLDLLGRRIESLPWFRVERLFTRN